MSLQQVASGGPLELPFLKQYEGLFAEGQHGELRLELRWPLDEDELYDLGQRLTDAGLEELGMLQTGNTLELRFRKGLPPLIILAVVLAIVLVALVVSWVLFREVGAWLGPALFLAIAGGGLLVAAGLRERIAGPTAARRRG